MSLLKEHDEPIFLGKLKSPILVCPKCGYIIAQGIEKERIRDLISYCPKCGSYLYLNA